MVCCSRCNRHYYAAESACPFCAEGGPSVSVGLRRLALIGGAALLLASCRPETPVISLYGPPPLPAPPTPTPTPSPSTTPSP